METARLLAPLCVSLALLLWWQHNTRSPTHTTPIELTPPRNEQPRFPPPYPSRPPKPTLPSLQQQVLALTQLGKDMALPQVLTDTPDLYLLVVERLDSAVAGNGEAQHMIYQALDECRPFLRLGPSQALAMNERMLGAGSDLSPIERQSWERSFRRCVGFAIHDWSHVGDALGASKPGAITEIASVWFARAVANGYPPALAERALRAGTLSTEERQRSLMRALQSGHPESYIACFLQHLDSEGRLQRQEALAWFLLACEAGLDCGEGASWLRSLSCAAECTDLPLLHYWNQIPMAEQQAVFALAEALPERIREGRAHALPLPNLRVLSELQP